MQSLTVVTLTEVSDEPQVKMTLPPLRVGDRISLNFTLRRERGGRSEVLEVKGDYRVSSVVFGTPGDPGRQKLGVEAIKKAPAWRAIKKAASEPKRLGPARTTFVVS